MIEVLREPAFRRLFASQVLSTLGDRLVVVALALYVSDIGTPTDVGIVLAAQTVPFIALLLIGGVWADRLPRQRVMVITDLVRAGLHALLAVLIFTGTPSILTIVVIEALFAAAHAFFRPAYTGLVPQTVPEHLIQSAQALNGAAYPLASLAGPAIGTALVIGLGAAWAFAVDAATFVVSAALLIGLRPRSRGEPAARQTVMADLVAGWREVASRRWVWVTIAAAAVGVGAGAGFFYPLGPTIAEAEHGDAAVFGIVVACTGAGNILGTVLAARWRPRRPIVTGLMLAVPWGVHYLLFALGVPVGVLVVAAVASGLGMTTFIIWWETALAAHIPPHALGRVAAYDWMGSMALIPVGYVLAGPLAERFGAVEVLAAGSVLVLATFAAAIVVLRQNDGMPASVVDASA